VFDGELVFGLPGVWLLGLPCRVAPACPRIGYATASWSAEREPDITPVTVVIQVSFSVALVLFSVLATCCEVGLSSSRESSTVSPVAVSTKR